MVHRARIVVVYLLIFLSVCFMSSCNKQSNDQEYVFNKKAIANHEGVYQGNIVKDKETALLISEVILTKTLGISKSEYDSSSVEFDKDKSVWVVSYYNKDILGGGKNIAISQKTGEVFIIWSDE